MTTADGADGAVRQPSVLHVNEAAFTARRMIAEATRRGYEIGRAHV